MALFDSGNFPGRLAGGGPFASVAFLVALSLEPALAASARNPYPPVKDNGTVGDAAGADTAAYLNDRPSDRTGRGSPASGTHTPTPPPDAPGTPPGPQNGPQAGPRDGAADPGNTNGTGNSNGTGSGSGPGAGGTGGPGVGPGSGGSGSGSGGGSGPGGM
jgi:hypothetical protein